MIQAVEYLGCGILWIGSMILTIVKKNPIGIAILSLMHGTEYFLIGRETAKQYGVKKSKALVMCLTFGFTWWLPLKQQIARETLTEQDFELTDEILAKFNH
ncbi:MAG: hypothetical protein IKT04_03855 [Clostridia bacterium]|nr:hypothetical protein [Clostridia bacterium]MBR6512303.1 hypothetical protein [Clostridia bacterium]